MFLPPAPGEDLGIYLTKPTDWGNDFDSGDGSWGLTGIWRQALNPNMGVRAGLVRYENDETDFIVGAETWGGLPLALPVDLTWTLGAGATLGENATWLRIPLGVSIGKTFGTNGGLRFTPYVLPRVAFDVIAIDKDVAGGGDDTFTEFNLVTDIGLDVALTPTVRLRLGGSFGEIDAFGAGLAFHFARKVAVQ